MEKAERNELAETVAEAVVRRIDERDKINLLAEAVIARLQELGLVAAAPTPGDPARKAALGARDAPG